MQIVIISPCLDVIFTHKIEWTDQLHSLKICTMQFWHHRLDLSAVKHSHQDRLDHIIIMMTQRNLITSHIFCKMIQMSSAHSRTEIARRLLHVKYRFKNVGFKDCDRNIQFLRIIFNNLAILRAVSRIHYKKLHFKIKLVVYFQFLKTFRHQHRIFSTGNTDCNLISRFYQFIRVDRFCKFRPDFFLEFLTKALFYFLCFLIILILIHLLFHNVHQPGHITAFQALCVISFFFQLFCDLHADFSSATADNLFFLRIQLFIF